MNTKDYIDESAAIGGSSDLNAMSVDVEEHFQVSAFAEQIDKRDWHKSPSRVARNMDRILELFDEQNAIATFFTLGWVAERAPEIVKAIAAQGHEVASHGYDHSRIWTQTPEQFREDVSRTKKILEDISGQTVSGYRAPSFSVTEDTLWAHDILQDVGYTYSSSIYPISHDHYGIPSSPRFPFRFARSGILEIPLTTAKAIGRNWPCAGGGYFRLLPLSYTSWAMRRVNRQDKMPIAFYFHPWEIDPDQPRIDQISMASRFRHYVNLERFESRLTSILKRYRWGRMDDVYSNALATN